MKTIKDFRKRVINAIANEEDNFTFEGGEFLTFYAKYMLEYIEISKISDDTLFLDVVNIE